MSHRSAHEYDDSDADAAEPEPDLSDDERAKIVEISQGALALLSRQPRQTMTLGDFIADLRDDLDVGSSMIDEVIVFMAASSWVQLWRHTGSNETWISAVGA